MKDIHYIVTVIRFQKRIGSSNEGLLCQNKDIFEDISLNSSCPCLVNVEMLLNPIIYFEIPTTTLTLSPCIILRGEDCLDGENVRVEFGNQLGGIVMFRVDTWWNIDVQSGNLVEYSC